MLKLINKKFELSDEMLFKCLVGALFVFVSLFCLLSVIFFNYIAIRSSAIFLLQHSMDKTDVFFNDLISFISSGLLDESWVVFIIMILAFFVGYYLAYTMIRPFKLIAAYCQQKTNQKSYQSSDFISNLKLLSQISYFFFAQIDLAYAKGKLKPVEIPENFTKIHRPKFEIGFFINYFLVVIIFAFISTSGIIYINSFIQEMVILLSKKFYLEGGPVNFYLDKQFEIMNFYLYFLVSTHVLVYILCGYYLYSKVATPAFAIFATMRSFMKGNYGNRIHLVGHSYLREDCRKINKYLEAIEKELT